MSDVQHAQVRALDWTDSLDPSRTTYVHAILDEVDADVVLAADVVSNFSRTPSRQMKPAFSERTIDR
ncbi:hypothetical protein FRC07_002185, partial [Ceratobasidium sp. 392]